jgi:hypothetical protein
MHTDWRQETDKYLQNQNLKNKLAIAIIHVSEIFKLNG